MQKFPVVLSEPRCMVPVVVVLADAGPPVVTHPGPAALHDTSRSRPHQRVGFTLIELLVVLAVVGILLSIAVTGFAAMNRKMAMEGQADQFRSLIRDGATLAATRSVPLALTVASGKATLRNTTTNQVLRTADVNLIDTGLGSNTIAFATDGRVQMPNPTSTLTVKINGKNHVLQVSGIGQSRWQ